MDLSCDKTFLTCGWPERAAHDGAEHHVGGSDQTRRSAALLHPHRPSHPRRGTSYHYLPPARYAEADPNLLEAAERALAANGVSVERGSTWTTDAPFRETATTIASRREEGILAVEMEAAALYAFANARGKQVLCFAHVTNQMALTDGDLEKGEANGARDALRLIDALVDFIDRR
jgi:uridine phosphorylase